MWTDIKRDITLSCICIGAKQNQRLRMESPNITSLIVDSSYPSCTSDTVCQQPFHHGAHLPRRWQSICYTKMVEKYLDGLSINDYEDVFLQILIGNDNSSHLGAVLKIHEGNPP